MDGVQGWKHNRGANIGLILLIFAALSGVSCSSKTASSPPTLQSISVTPANPSIAKGTTKQLTATGTYSDNSTQDLTASVTWSSDTPGVATVSNAAGSQGLATAVGTGSANIQASLNSVPGSTKLTVTSAVVVSIAVTPADPSIAKGTTKQFSAMGTFSDHSTQDVTTSATWSSDTPGVATVSNAAGSQGLATAVGTGSANIQASLNSVPGSTKLTVTSAVVVSVAVTPANQTIAQGVPQPFTATATFSDQSTQNVTASAMWNSTQPTIASVTATGVVTGLKQGSLSLKATFDNVPGSTNLSVSGVSLLGVIVSPQNPAIADAGATQTFAATGKFSDGSTQTLTSLASWSSSSTAVASVNGAGVATSATLGSGTTAAFTQIQATVGAVSGESLLSVTSHTGNGFAGVFTQHNDLGRTGQDVNETTLTPASVNSTNFGKKFSQPVDGYVYAQPLYVPNVAIPGKGTHNIVIVATEADSVYAFDADNNSGGNSTFLWHASLLDAAHGAAAGATPVSSNDIGCSDLMPQVGVTSTPVVNPATGTIYVEANSKESGSYLHRLHALDITSGAEKSPGPVVITASVPGTADGGTTINFNGIKEFNRPGLLWLNGKIYIGFGSHCDIDTYHGWLFAYDAGTFQQDAVFVTTPNGAAGYRGAIWMAGTAPAADANGNIFFATGNGGFDTGNIPATNLSDTIFKMQLFGTQMSLADYFTPWNQGTLDGGDTDVGSGGILLLPDQAGNHTHELVEAGKEGTIYLIDRDQMTAGNLHYCPSNCNNMDSQIVQELQLAVGGMWSAPAFWNGTIYTGGSGDNVKAFSISSGAINSTPTSATAGTFNFPGPTPSISANGNTGGIVWVIDASGYGPPAENNATPAILHAYDATNLGNELYNSTQAANNRDAAGNAVKFTVPTVANGKVYIGTETELDVYGPLP
ncbi:MAG: Ig-like domain-containing protein [Candidatus Acidiferrales bacterium]